MPPQMIDVGVRLKVNGPYNLRPVVDSIKKGVNSSMGSGFSSSAVDVKNLHKDLSGLGNSLSDVKQRARQAQSVLKDMGASAAGPGINKLHKEIATTMRQLNGLQGRLTSSRLEFRRFGEEAAVSLRRFGAFAASAIVFVRLTRAIRDSFTEAMQFQKAMVQLGQMGVGSAKDIKSVADNITYLSKSLGASSAELAEVSKYLKGAGMSVTEVNEALTVLAKTSLSPTFKDLRSTQEGLLSLRAQFKLTAKEYASAFDSINAVSQQFAAEADDIVTAIKRAGSAFSAASGQMTAPKQQLQELISLFTAVQGTTKESADTIGTAFRTIFARLQSNAVVNDLRQMGIELRYTAGEAKAFGQNVEGQFVGAYTAVQRLSEALKNVPTTDPRFAAVVEKIGGQRQVSKVLPLIQQFPMAQKALATAQTSNNSLNRDSAKGMDAYLNKLRQVKEEFNELFRVVVNSSTFSVLVTGFTTAASAATTFLKAMEPMIPLIAAMGTLKIGLAFKEVVPAFARTIVAGKRRITGFAEGGSVPGEGNRDSVPAMLMPKEFVFNKKAAASAGHGKLNAFNRNPDNFEIVSRSSYGNDRDEQLGGLHKQLAEAIKAKGGMSAMYPERFARGGTVKKRPGVVSSLSPQQVKDAFKSIGINFDPSKLASGVDYMTPDSVAGQVGGAADAFFNPGSKKIGINANTNRDVTQLLGHEFAHAISTSAGSLLGVGNTATKAQGTIFNTLGQVGRKEFFQKKMGMFKGSLEDHYKNNLGITNEDDLNEEGFANLFEQFVSSKQRATAGKKPLKAHTSPAVLKAFSTIENQLLPAVGKLGGNAPRGRVAASSEPLDFEDEMESGLDSYVDSLRRKKKRKRNGSATLDDLSESEVFANMLTGRSPEEQAAVQAFLESQGEGKKQVRDMVADHIVTGGDRSSVRGTHFGAIKSKTTDYSVADTISDKNRVGRGEVLTGSSEDYLSDDQVNEEIARKRLEKIGIGVQKKELDAEVKKVGNNAVIKSPVRRRIGTSEGVAKIGGAKIKDFVADTKARAEVSESIPLTDDTSYTDMLGNKFNYEHPVGRVQAGLQSIAKSRGLGGDIAGTRDHILAGIQSGTYDLPAFTPGESPPALHAVKTLAEELGFESNISRDKSTGGYTGKFQKKMTSDELFAAAKSQGLLQKYGSLNDVRSTLSSAKDADRQFIMNPDVNPLKERLMKQVAAEQGAKIQKRAAGQYIKGTHQDFDPEDTNFGQSVAKAKAAKASKAISGAGLPALRSGGKHQFINDYLKGKTFGSYDERVAAAKEAKDIYEGYEAGGSGVFSAGGSGGGRRRGRPPGSGGGSRGGGMSDSPKVVSILEKILSEVKGISSKLGGSNGSGGSSRSRSTDSKTRTRRTKKGGTVSSGSGIIDGLPALGSDMARLGLPKPYRRDYEHPDFISNVGSERVGILDIDTSANTPFRVPLDSNSFDPTDDTYGLEGFNSASPYNEFARNPQRGPYQDLADNSHVNVKRYKVTKDFDVKVRRGLERRKHADPLSRINPRNTSERLERARQLREQRAISRFDADDFVSGFGFAPIGVPGDGEETNPDIFDFDKSYYNNDKKSFMARMKDRFKRTPKNEFLGDGYALQKERGRFGKAYDYLNRPIFKGLATKASDISDKFGGFASGLAEKYSPDGKLGGLALAGIGAASSFAPQAVAQLTGTIEQPGRYGVQGAKFGAGVGGALQYGGIGASLGSALGPVGMAVGGMTGAAIGFVGALKEADDKLRELDFEKDFSKMADSLEGVLAGKMKLNSSSVGDVNKGLSRVNLEAAIKSSNSVGITGAIGEKLGYYKPEENRAFEQTERSKFIRDKLVPLAPQLQEFGNKIASNLKLTSDELTEGGQAGRIDKFKKAGGSKIAEGIAAATDTSLKAVYESFDKAIIETNRERVAREANTKAIQEQTVQIQQFGLISDAIEAATNSISHLQTGADALQSAFNGSLQAINVKSFANDAKIGNIDQSAFSSAMGNITSSLGNNPLASSLGSTARGVNSAAISLPDIISRANASGGIEDKGLVGRIEEGMQASDSGIPDMIRNKLSTVLDSFDPEELAKAASENVKKLADDLIEKGFANVNAVLETAAKQLEERANAFNQGLIANQDMINKIGETYNKRARLEIVAAQSEGRVRAAATGNSSLGDVSLDDMNKPFRRQQEFLTGMSGSDASNPEVIGNRLRSTQAQITATKNRRDSASGENQGQLSEQLATLQGNAQRLGQALENLADSSDRNATIQEKINKLEEDRQGRLSFTEKLLTADPKQRREMQRNSNLSDVAVQQGNFAGFNAKQIQGVLEHLSSLGNVSLPTYGGATGADVQQRLLSNSGAAIGTIDPRNERTRIGLLGQQAQNDKTAVVAQDEIAKSQTGLQQEFFGQLKTIQQDFFSKLAVSLAEAEKRDITTQQGIVSGKQKDLSNASQSLGNLKASGFSLEESRMLNSNGEIGELGDRIERRKALGGNIASLKGALKNNPLGAIKGGILNVDQERNLTSSASEFLGVDPEQAAKSITVPLKSKIKGLGARSADPKAVDSTINSFLDEYQRNSASELDSATSSMSGRITKQVFGSVTPEGRDKVKRFAAGQKDYSKMVTSLDPFVDEQALSKQQASVTKQAASLESQAGLTQVQQRAVVNPTSVPSVLSGPGPEVGVARVVAQQQIAGVATPIAAGAVALSNPVAMAKKKKRATYIPSGNPYSRDSLDPKMREAIEKQEGVESDRKRLGSITVSRAVREVDADSKARQDNRVKEFAPRIAAQEKKDAERRAKFAADFKRATGKDLPSGPPTARDPSKGIETPKEIRNRRRAAAQGNGNFVPPQLQQQQNSAPTADPQAALGQNVQGLNGVVDGLNKAVFLMGSQMKDFGKLLEGFKLPDKIVLERNGKIEVVVNGTEAINAIKGDLSESLIKDMMASLQQQLPKMIANLPA